MIRRWVLATLAGLLCFTPACTQQQQQQMPDTRAADEQAIRAIEADWGAVVGVAGAKDIDKWMSFYADDAAVFNPNEAAMIGKASIRGGLMKMLATPEGQSMTLSFMGRKVVVARSGDLAYSEGTYTSSMKDAKGKPITDKGNYVTVWKKGADGTWKAVADIYNSDLPLPAAASSK
jgi:ketosteroid isomerase-like protein